MYGKFLLLEGDIFFTFNKYTLHAALNTYYTDNEMITLHCENKRLSIIMLVAWLL